LKGCKNLNVPKHDEYDHTGYARGHLMPYAAWYNTNPEETRTTLNYFINAAPQIGIFNSGA
jgi:hypothetical protein